MSGKLTTADARAAPSQVNTILIPSHLLKIEPMTPCGAKQTKSR